MKDFLGEKGQIARKKHSEKVLKRMRNEARTSSVLAKERKVIKATKKAEEHMQERARKQQSKK